MEMILCRRRNGEISEKAGVGRRFRPQTRGRGRPINSILLGEGGREGGMEGEAGSMPSYVGSEGVAEFALHVFQFEISHVRAGK